MHRKLPIPAVASTICLTLAAAGCGAEPGAMDSSSSMSPRASTPTKPKPNPPTMPRAAMDGLTVTSAEAFARFYLAALDYAEATGDARLLRQWQDAGCENCKTVIDVYESIYRAGGSVTGQLGTRVVRVSDAHLIRSDGAIVVFKTMAGRTSLRRSATSKPTVLPGGPGTTDFTLKARGGHWSVFEVEIYE